MSDVIAATYGHPPADYPAKVAEAVATIEDKFAQLTGLPDLAERALALVLDPDSKEFGI